MKEDGPVILEDHLKTDLEDKNGEKWKKTESGEKTKKNGNCLFKNGILKFLKRKIPMSASNIKFTDDDDDDDGNADVAAATDAVFFNQSRDIDRPGCHGSLIQVFAGDCICEFIGHIQSGNFLLKS